MLPKYFFCFVMYHNCKKSAHIIFYEYLPSKTAVIRGPPRNESQKLADLFKLWEILHKEIIIANILHELLRPVFEYKIICVFVL